MDDLIFGRNDNIIYWRTGLTPGTPDGTKRKKHKRTLSSLMSGIGIRKKGEKSIDIDKRESGGSTGSASPGTSVNATTSAPALLSGPREPESDETDSEANSHLDETQSYNSLQIVDDAPDTKTGVGVTAYTSDEETGESVSSISESEDHGYLSDGIKVSRKYLSK